MTRAASNQAPVIYGDGSQSRDFVYVKDVVNANLLAAGVNHPRGRVFNIGTGSRVCINRLWELIAALSGQKTPAPRYEPARAGDILHSYAAMEFTEANLKFNPEFSLEQGLDLTFEWYKEVHNS